MLTLVVDTETTGLPPKNVTIYETLNWPHIIQMSWVIYDDTNDQIVEEKDYIIQLGSNIPISDKSIELHGITREISIASGVQIDLVLFDFNVACQKCSRIVGHNLDFDIKMIKVESIRSRIHNVWISNDKYCTMLNGTSICRIEMAWSGNPNVKTYKYPKLIELHETLFPGEAVENAHNSKADVDMCLRCYVKMTKDYDLLLHNAAFRDTYCKTFARTIGGA